MKRSLRLFAIFSWGVALNGVPLMADGGSSITVTNIVSWLFGALGIGYALYTYIKRRRDERAKQMVIQQAQQDFKEDLRAGNSRTSEEVYRAVLKEELGYLQFMGSPDVDCSNVPLEDAFVSLCVSESWRSEERFGMGPGKEKQMENMHRAMKDSIGPAQVMARAFKEDAFRLLMVIGDPGSGKTTLMKHYAQRCLDYRGKGWLELGFSQPVFPIYFPLRDLQFGEDGRPVLLPAALERWAVNRNLNIGADQFSRWLRERTPLVLLDGLDEIAGTDRRKQVCIWVGNLCKGYPGGYFVVTSRATGYRKLDGIEMEFRHLRADVLDFTPGQQEEYLYKWFEAVYLSCLPPPAEGDVQQWRESRRREARERVPEIVEFLRKEENRSVRELAAVPMLLEIMAVLWKDRKVLPKTRFQLYEAALKYLLEHRPRTKGVEPPVPAEEALRVLAPTALWMQEELGRDEANKAETHRWMQPHLNTLEGQPDAAGFCEYLRDDAGLIADVDREHYIFRHKSFREFLAGMQLKEEGYQPGRVEQLTAFFSDDWWEEALRFFMCLGTKEFFDRFMKAFFSSPVSRDLDANERKLLLLLVKDAPAKRIDALVERLGADDLEGNSRSYILDCLKAIGTPEARAAVNNARLEDWSEMDRKKAADIVAESVSTMEGALEMVPVDNDALSFRNPIEFNVEYIKIPGGTFNYSRAEEKQSVQDFFLCKTPVTNARYRRFIDYLSGKEKELAGKLPPDRFSSLLLEFSGIAKEDGVIHKGFREYLGEEPDELKSKLRSRYDDTKKYNGADQPVLGVSWYHARSYCFWLSCMEAALKDKASLKDIRRLSGMYRLPDEKEWEWAAGGNPDGTVREYPWPAGKGAPSPKLANYDGNVGTTTPVGSYPEGATPLGLMDMAGNVWEWMENYRDNKKRAPALCGGSWNYIDNGLRCRARLDVRPHDRFLSVGFRPFRPIKDGGWEAGKMRG